MALVFDEAVNNYLLEMDVGHNVNGKVTDKDSLMTLVLNKEIILQFYKHILLGYKFSQYDNYMHKVCEIIPGIIPYTFSYKNLEELYPFLRFLILSNFQYEWDN